MFSLIFAMNECVVTIVNAAEAAPCDFMDGVVGVDTETGGLHCETDALLSVGIFTMLPGEVPFSLVVYIVPNPGLRMDPEALLVNGYTEEKWRARGAVVECVGVMRVLGFLSEIRRKVGKRLSLVAHNAGFDGGFLGAAFERYEALPLLHGDDGVASRRWECSCATLGAVRRAGLLPPGGCSLDDLVAVRTGTPLLVVKEQRGTHAADVDARVCWHGYQWLLELMRQGAAR